MLPYTRVSHISVTVTNLPGPSTATGRGGPAGDSAAAVPVPRGVVREPGRAPAPRDCEGGHAAMSEGSVTLRHTRPSLRAGGGGRRRLLRAGLRERPSVRRFLGHARRTAAAVHPGSGRQHDRAHRTHAE